jgi:toxin ParE1/3/4
LARYRLSDPAKADIAAILYDSEVLFGVEARIRYRGLLTAALRRVAADPLGLSTADRSEVLVGLRSLHSRHCRMESRQAPVARPVHVLFYRPAGHDLVEIVRVLHERMEPTRYVTSSEQDR